MQKCDSYIQKNIKKLYKYIFTSTKSEVYVEPFDGSTLLLRSPRPQHHISNELWPNSVKTRLAYPMIRKTALCRFPKIKTDGNYFV